MIACFLVIAGQEIKKVYTGTPSESDAIAIRILKNPDNWHPSDWFEQMGYEGNIEKKTVDGYKAIRSGRTTYVNVGNVEGGELDTYIYLISYDQGADSQTEEIYKRMIQNWSFNNNLDDLGECNISSIVCSEEEDCPENYSCQEDGDYKNKCLPEEGFVCRTDKDCPEGLFCDSEKAKVTRDTVRLGDLARMEILLENYKAEHGQYPKLTAGTYLPGKTISTWPSWDNEFSEKLGGEVPTPPINTLGPCEIQCCPDGCSNPEICDYEFDPRTCWDEINKWFAVPDPESGEFEIPYNSHVYAYKTSPYSYTLCASTEYTDKNTVSNCYGLCDVHGSFCGDGMIDCGGCPGEGQVCEDGVCVGTETVHIQQPGGIDEVLNVTFSTDETPEDFYNYQNASFNNDDFYYILEADKSVLFLHYSEILEVVSLGMIHDFPNNSFGGTDIYGNEDPDGGSMEFLFSNMPSGNRIAVEDDPGDMPGWDVGYEIVDGDVWSWGWGTCCTDGGMIEIPQDSWSLTIEPISWSGIDTWQLAYRDSSGDFSFIDLDMNSPINISYTRY